MRTARPKIDLGIGGLRTKRAQTGALILEISGQERAAKMDALAISMTAALAGMERIKVV